MLARITKPDRLDPTWLEISRRTSTVVLTKCIKVTRKATFFFIRPVYEKTGTSFECIGWAHATNWEWAS